jgi:hypothetical protein
MGEVPEGCGPLALRARRSSKNIGVDKCNSFITDGHSEYFGKGGHKVVSPPVHEKLSIAERKFHKAFKPS